MVNLFYKILENGLKKYAKIRNKLNPYKEPKDKKLWNSLANLSIGDFSDKINSMKYKSDKLFGAVDRTSSVDTFFNKKKNGRDCDDYARMWFTYGVLKGYNAYEVIVANKKKIFSTSHVITILEKNNHYILCNYRPFYGGIDTFDEALDRMRKAWSIYGKDMIWAHGITKEIKK